jgi:hypothetical protein
MKALLRLRIPVKAATHSILAVGADGTYGYIWELR